MPAKLNFFRKLQEGQRIDHTSAIVLARVRTQTAGQKIRRHQLSLQLPNISGSYRSICTRKALVASGVLDVKGTAYFNDSVTATTTGGFDLDASRGSSVFGASTTVQPASLNFLPCIKF